MAVLLELQSAVLCMALFFGKMESFYRIISWCLLFWASVEVLQVKSEILLHRESSVIIILRIMEKLFPVMVVSWIVLTASYLPDR